MGLTTMRLSYRNIFVYQMFSVLMIASIFQAPPGQAISQVLGMKFSRDVLCDIDGRLSGGCSTQIPKVRSKFECVSFCMAEASCIGASINGSGVCFKHNKCPSIAPCGTSFNTHHYLIKTCDNGGLWIPSLPGCQCVGGWVGQSCQEHPRFCTDLILHGYPQGYHKTVLDPEQDMENLAPVWCFIEPGGMYEMIPVIINSGRTDFNRTWDEYRNGFEDEPNSTPLWIGLKQWHYLSQAGYTHLYIVTTVQDLGQMYREYIDFRVSDEENMFSYTHGSNYENRDIPIINKFYFFGDCFGPLQNTSFSAWDRDNDKSADKNCASRAGSGWWYQDCNNPCNILGWGTDYWNTKPSYERLRQLGFDIEKEKDKEIEMYAYLTRD